MGLVLNTIGTVKAIGVFGDTFLYYKTAVNEEQGVEHYCLNMKCALSSCAEDLVPS